MRVPYTYVVVTRNVRRVESSRHMDAHAEFEPRSVDAEDAPVVLRHAGFHGFHARFGDEDAVRGRAAGRDDGLTDVRAFEGGLYEAVMVVAGYGEDATRAPCPETELATLDGVLRVMGDVPWISKRRSQAHAAKEVTYHPETTRLEAHRSEREDALREVREALDVIVVDGVVHRRTAEPVFQYDKGVVSVRKAHQASGATYRLDEVELLADRIRAGGVGDVEAVVAAAGDMARVIDPSPLRHAQTRGTTWAAVHELIAAARYGFSERGPEAMMAFADLRDAMQGRGETDERTLVHLVTAFCDAAELDDVGGWQRMSAHAIRVARAEVRAWHARATRALGEPHDHDLDGLELDAPSP